MIAVTGATGELGQLVVEALANKISPQEVVALARSVEKAKDIEVLGVQIRHADYNDLPHFEIALKDVTKLLLISSNDLKSRVEQHRHVIAAAKKAGVKLIAYTSVLHADRSVLGLAEDHRKTEEALKKSGIPFVILRNGWYTENYTAGVHGAIEHGAVFGAAGDGKISSATRADYAEAAALILTSSENQAGKVYELAGDTSYTLKDLAVEISEQCGRTIAYKNLSQGDYQSFLTRLGVPDAVANLLSDSDAGAAKRALFDESKQLSQLIGRPTTSLKKAVAAGIAKKKH